MKALQRFFCSVALFLAGCGDQTAEAVRLPDPPPPIQRPDEYPFGDRTASLENRAAGRVARLLGPRFGQPRETHFVAPIDTDFDQLREWYDVRAREAGWHPMESLARGVGPGQAMFGYEHADRAFVVSWITDAAQGDGVPLTIIRFGG